MGREHLSPQLEVNLLLLSSASGVETLSIKLDRGRVINPDHRVIASIAVRNNLIICHASSDNDNF
jgi:hypothetical protein